MRRFIQSQGRTSKPQVWEVRVTKNASVIVEWGQQDGKMQRTEQSFATTLNKGKKNEKSPQQQAEEFADREILLHTRKGYREVDLRSGKFLESASATTIDFNCLPENLRFFKPQNSVNVYTQKLIDSGNALFLRKRDGMMHVVCADDDGSTCMYSSTMQPFHKDEPGVPWFDRYPHIKSDLRKMKLPPRTVLLGELVTCVAGGYKDDNSMAVDDHYYVGSVVKSLTPRALELQKRKSHLGICVWDIAFWDGECWLQTKTAEARLNELYAKVSAVKTMWVSVPEIIQFTEKGYLIESFEGNSGKDLERDTTNPTKWLLEFAKAKKWEGYVVVDPDSKYGDRAYSMHGKAERPKYVCKLKPKFEADFIVRWDPEKGIGSWGKGKKSKGIGAVALYLYDEETNQEVYICDMGGGLTDANVAKFANKKLYPMVWQIEFDSWTPKGALRFPEFIRVRDDKQQEDCPLSQRPSAEAEDAEEEG